MQVREVCPCPVLNLWPLTRTMRFSIHEPSVEPKALRCADIMRLDLADLQLFLAIAEAGSITQGAVRANLSLAAASERLRKIEDDLGLVLLQRLPRGVGTTQAGEALAHHARVILQQRALMKDELRDYATGARGTLTFYANTAALTDFLPERLAPWLAQRPGLRIDLKERTSEEIVSLIAGGLAEAGIISSAVSAPGLHVRNVAKDHLALVVPEAHRLAGVHAIDFAEVLAEPFVGLAHGNALQDHIEAHARAHGRLLDVRIRMKTFEGLGQMVAHGVGLGIVPDRIARRLRRRCGYRLLSLNDDWAQRQLRVCFRAWEGLSLPMRHLMRHLGVDKADLC